MKTSALYCTLTMLSSCWQQDHVSMKAGTGLRWLYTKVEGPSGKYQCSVLHTTVLGSCWQQDHASGKAGTGLPTSQNAKHTSTQPPAQAAQLCFSKHHITSSRRRTFVNMQNAITTRIDDDKGLPCRQHVAEAALVAWHAAFLLLLPASALPRLWTSPEHWLSSRCSPSQSGNSVPGTHRVDHC